MGWQPKTLMIWRKADEEYTLALRELQICPWTMGLNVFDKIDQLTKCFIQTKDYARAEESLKFGIDIGGSYHLIEQLAALYKLQGKTAMAKEAEQSASDYVIESADNWDDGQALRNRRFYCLGHLQSARSLGTDTYEVTLDNGMVLHLPTTNPNKGNGLKSDPTLASDFQPQPPDNIVHLAERRTLVLVFKKLNAITPLDYCLCLAGRFYQATLVSDVHKQYLSDTDSALAEDLFAFRPLMPSTIVAKEADKSPGWWKITLNRKGYWAEYRACTFKLAEVEAKELNKSDRILLLGKTSGGGFLSYRFLLLKDGQVLKQIRPTEPPYKEPMLAYPRYVIQGQPRQSPPDYSLAKCLIEGSEALCQSKLAQPLDITQGQPLLSNVQFARFGQMALCPVTLTNGMSFDVIVSSFQNRPSDSLATNPIVADKGAQALVFVKSVGSLDDPAEKQLVYSLFVGGNLYEAIPSSSLVQGKYKARVAGLEDFIGVCCTEISGLANSKNGSTVSFINGTDCEVSAAGQLKKGPVLILWNAQDDGEKFKLLTEGGAYDAEPPHNELSASGIEARKLINQPVAVANPLEWARSGWYRSLTGPTSGLMVSVAYPIEFQQAVAATSGAGTTPFDCQKWIGQFTWGMRELWWHLLTQAQPNIMILNPDIAKTAVPKMPVLKSDPAPGLPKFYVTGEAQILVSIARIGQARKVTAKVLQSNLPDNCNQVLVQSIEANSDHAIFCLPDLPQFDNASFLVRFRLRNQ